MNTIGIIIVLLLLFATVAAVLLLPASTSAINSADNETLAPMPASEGVAR